MRRQTAIFIGMILTLVTPGLTGNGSAKGDAPNILLIVSDDLQACLGSYGNTVCRTPHLDRLAAEGVSFDRAYCQFPLCGPSRASLMSGLYPARTRMLNNSHVIGSFHLSNPELADHPSLGGFLRRHGYVSLRVSKIYHMGVPGGIEEGAAGGDDPDSWDRAFNVMAPETASPGQLELLSPKRKHYGSNFARVIVPNGQDITQADHMTATHAIAMLENRAKGSSASKFLRPDEPFFLAVGFVRPHVPLIAPQRLFDLYPEESARLPEFPEGDLDDVPGSAAGMENFRRYGMDDRQQRQALSAYYASVSYMDEQVGRLLDALDRLNLRKNTIVVFTSDHGYNLGEHGCWQKLSLFEDSVRVPLIISAPDMQATSGQRNQSVVELIDLYPTLLDLTGHADAAPEILQGSSLVPLMRDPSSTDPDAAAYTVTQQQGHSLRTARWRYSRWGKSTEQGGGEELYDHNSDPHEFHNVAGSLEYSDVLTDMRRRMDRLQADSH